MNQQYQVNPTISGSEMQKQNQHRSKLWLVVAVVLLLAVGVGSYYLLRHKTPQVTTTQKETNFLYEATVKIGADGFNPAVLTVKPRTRVNFENHDSASAHGVVQNPGNNPSDTAFDAPDIPAPNSSSQSTTGGQDPYALYTYDFNNVGTYYYHDPVSPTHNGQIIVSAK